jgi:hypothetical protein
MSDTSNKGAGADEFSLDLKDPQLKKRVLECIEKNSKLSVFKYREGAKPGENGFTRVD